jgi:hypothetical protein
MFFLYGPQAPTAFANGPSCTQYQAEWLANFLDKTRSAGINRIEATTAAEKEWVKRVHDAWNASLFPKAKSWYQGSNIPGKPLEALNWSVATPFLSTTPLLTSVQVRRIASLSRYSRQVRRERLPGVDCCYCSIAARNFGIRSCLIVADGDVMTSNVYLCSKLELLRSHVTFVGTTRPSMLCSC